MNSKHSINLTIVIVLILSFQTLYSYQQGYQYDIIVHDGSEIKLIESPLQEVLSPITMDWKKDTDCPLGMYGMWSLEKGHLTLTEVVRCEDDSTFTPAYFIDSLSVASRDTTMPDSLVTVVATWYSDTLTETRDNGCDAFEINKILTPKKDQYQHTALSFSKGKATVNYIYLSCKGLENLVPHRGIFGSIGGGILAGKLSGTIQLWWQMKEGYQGGYSLSTREEDDVTNISSFWLYHSLFFGYRYGGDLFATGKIGVQYVMQSDEYFNGISLEKRNEDTSYPGIMIEAEAGYVKDFGASVRAIGMINTHDVIVGLQVSFIIGYFY
ncbi:MAG: hypothetical protein OCD01_15920 [Fibrobacterales bacterium]